MSHCLHCLLGNVFVFLERENLGWSDDAKQRKEREWPIIANGRVTAGSDGFLPHAPQMPPFQKGHIVMFTHVLSFPGD